MLNHASSLDTGAPPPGRDGSGMRAARRAHKSGQPGPRPKAGDLPNKTYLQMPVTIMIIQYRISLPHAT